MIDLIASNLNHIEQLCKRHRVRSLDLFGSAVSSAFNASESDIDFLVEFLPDAPRTGLSGAYFALRDDLAELLGKPIDLIERNALVNPFVIESAENTRVPLYAAA